MDKPPSFAEVSARVARIPLDFPQRRGWWLGMGVALLLCLVFVVAAGVLFLGGVGIWGVDSPVFWGFAIMNYVWWVGIGNAGTLISGLLLLLNQVWRNGLNRFAEAMAVFAIVCAGIFPILHLGRPWLFYWMFPYPNEMGVWPQFRSPLTWDVFAILIYLIVSILFWYLGLIPDLEMVRDKAQTRAAQVIYGVLAVGWHGSARAWQHWQRAYRFIAALAVALVVSVHSEVAMLFAASALPGWHSTLFPPFFVVGAAFSGFGVVTMLTVVIRKAFHLEALITQRHLEALAKITLGLAIAMGYGYGWEIFDSLYGADPHDLALIKHRLFGHYGWSFWLTIALNVGVPQLLWLPRFRRQGLALFLIGLAVTIGMWFERYMLVVSSLSRSFLPSSWGNYTPSFWDWSLFAGTIGVFLLGYLLFLRFLPAVSASEIKERMAEP
jgi:molybdopterin-containing oxidoreductase family membrane subunit